MKPQFPLTLSLILSTLSLPSFAHDPKLHEQAGAAAPDCAAMKNMDMSKMDPNDPVTKAMQEQCKGRMAHESMQGHDMKDMPGMDRKTPPSADKDQK